PSPDASQGKCTMSYTNRLYFALASQVSPNDVLGLRGGRAATRALGGKTFVGGPKNFWERYQRNRRIYLERERPGRWSGRAEGTVPSCASIPAPSALSSVGFSLMPLWVAVDRHGAGREPSRGCSATVLGVYTPPARAAPDRARPGCPSGHAGST